LLDRYLGQVRHVVRDLRPNARAMVELAAPRFAAGLGVDPAIATPLYIRNKVAVKEKER
jgi:tRNA threonylcarbamoyladenosine biosynthesis protein TsaB